MDISEFLAVYDIRSPQIMWFLGAGASAAGGIPTAYDMIWDFKRRMYCTAQRIPITSLDDLSDPNQRSRIQRYFDSRTDCPPLDSDDEYAFYFETLYKDAADRQRYIEQMVSSAHPSFGHKALAVLLRLDKAHVVWTTNFDRLIEDAVALAYGSTSKLVTATLGEPDIAMQAINDGRWPILVKLHGDFQSRRLKNISEELRDQDRKLRDALIEACCRYGLAVVGYSGRDESVMDVLMTAVESGRGFPNGLFWFCRSNGTVSSAVQQLIDKARSAGINAEVITAETFDELLPATLSLVEEIPSDLKELLTRSDQRMSNPPLLPTQGTFPYIRLDALYVPSVPGICRLVRCSIGGSDAVREAVASAGKRVIAARKNVGVLAFGSDADIRETFAPYGIEALDIHHIPEHRLAHDGAEHGLMHDALCAALSRERPVRVERGRFDTLVVDPERLTDPLYAPLREAVSRHKGLHNDKIAGTIEGIPWAEALRIRLEFRLGRVWLLTSPTVWVDWPEGADRRIDMDQHADDPTSPVTAIKEFVRERQSTRYNRVWHDVMVAWIKLITGGNDECDLQSLGIADGMDAKFTITKSSAFSRRVWAK